MLLVDCLDAYELSCLFDFDDNLLFSNSIRTVFIQMPPLSLCLCLLSLCRLFLSPNSVFVLFYRNLAIHTHSDFLV